MCIRDRNESEFKPVKINGVFRLPDYLKQQISDETWEMCIDDTFEIQLKTVFFEGWHEIEHEDVYKRQVSRSRQECLTEATMSNRKKEQIW